MKKSSTLFIISLIALLLTACKPSTPKKKKTSSSSGQVTTSASVTPGPTSGETPTSIVPGPTSSVTPTSGSKPVPPSTSYVPPEPHPAEGYEECDKAYNNHDKDGLLSALRSYTSQGQSGSYNDLWETYKTVYIRADGKMFDYYSCITNFTPGKDQAGSYSGEGDAYNREHSIPKSWWGGGTSNQGADPYIVIPTDGWVNGMRSNFSFGMVKTIDKQSAQGFCKKGTSDPDWLVTDHPVFEPDDSVKGDLARIYFYAIARYSNSYNWTQDDDAGLCFTGKNDANFGFTDYAVKLLSYWSQLDPVSEWELTVSDRCAPIHGCRNPFVDHPEYANVLWGHNSNYTPYTYSLN